MIKVLLKYIGIHKLINNLFDYCLESYVCRNPEFYIKVKRRYEKDVNRNLHNHIGNIGYGCKLQGNIYISHPKGVILGNNVYLSDGLSLHSRGGIVIMDNCCIDENVTIYSNRPKLQSEKLPFDTKLEEKIVVIKDNVHIQSNTIIMPGVTIGEGAVIKAGSFVNDDIEPCCIVSPEPAGVNDELDPNKYAELKSSRRYADFEGKALTLNTLNNFYCPASNQGENVFFVLSTGRCGSASISKILSRHDEIYCHHEPKLPLVRISTEYAHGEKSAEEVRTVLTLLYREFGYLPEGKLYGESDQKLSNLAPILHLILPKAKYIWLIRNPVDAVNSTYSRGWFSDSELGFTIEERTAHNLYAGVYSDYRIHADKIGVMSHYEWREMDAFERNCWYWRYWNDMIEGFLKKLPRKQSMKVWTNDLQSLNEDIYQFLGVSCKALIDSVHVNKAKSTYDLVSQGDWSPSMEKAFKKWCCQ